MKRIVVALTLIGVSLTPVAASAQSAACFQPTVNTLIAAEAAVSRPAINSPAEYALSNVYSALSQATKPQFVYAEAGPQFTGAFEALSPPGTPKPPRAVSAYPSEDIPDDDVEDWGGQSRTTVTPISALALSSGSQPLGLGDFAAQNSRSWVSSIVECDTITVVAGWEANSVTVVPGSTIEQLGQSVTIVIGPDGASADVTSTLVGAEGFSEVPIEGRPTDPFTDPTADNGGPRIDVGEPRTSADADGASASGGGFNFLFLDPEAGQGAGYRIGSLNAQIDVLGALDPNADNAPVVPGDSDTGSVSPIPKSPTTSAPVGLLPKQPVPAQQPVAKTVVGTPPAPSRTAIAAVESATVAIEFDDVIVTTKSWFPLFVLLASILFFAQVTAVIRIGQRWDPTLAWIVRHGDRARERFATVYLKW